MSEGHPEIVILVVTLLCLAMAPLASRLVGQMGRQISSEIGGREDDPADEAEEIRQLIEAKAFVRGETAPDVEGEVMRVKVAQIDPELRDEVVSVVLALNERREARGDEPLDVDREVRKRLALYFGA